MQDLKARSKRFALDVIRFVRTLPQGDEYVIVRRQLIRAATSTAANYRAAQRAKSRADFAHKLCIVEEEADESLFWLECLGELDAGEHLEHKRLISEANELVSIFTASRKTARA